MADDKIEVEKLQGNNDWWEWKYWSFQNVFALDISHFHSSNSKSIRAKTYEIYASK